MHSLNSKKYLHNKVGANNSEHKQIWHRHFILLSMWLSFLFLSKLWKNNNCGGRHEPSNTGCWLIFQANLFDETGLYLLKTAYL